MSIFGNATMMQQMLKILKPHLNKIGESLVNIHAERQLPDTSDVRIVILAKRDPHSGHVHTMMAHVESAPNPTPEMPDLRVTNTLLDEHGKPMIYGIGQLVGLLGGGE